MDKKTALEHLRGIILEELANTEHNIGENCYEYNCLSYDEDGWWVSMNYFLYGEYLWERGDYWTPDSTTLSYVTASIDDLSAGYDNEETGEYVELDRNDLLDLRKEILKEIENIVYQNNF